MDPTPPSPASGGDGELPSLRLGVRKYFSTLLLWTAFYASGNAGRIEKTHTGGPTFDIEHRASVLTAIVSAAVFLEAAVNEFFQDAHDGQGREEDGHLAPLSARTVEAMAALWKGTDRGKNVNTPEKWQLFLVLAERAPLDRGAAPFQDAQLVTQLRNEILHFRPEVIWAGEPHGLGEKLRQRKFVDNPLMAGSMGPWWPDHCLGHGCAEWAARSALDLAEDVCRQLGIKPNYQHAAESGWFGKPPGSLGT